MWSVLLGVLAGCSKPVVAMAPTAVVEPAVLAVSGYHSDAVHLFDGDTGEALGVLEHIRGAQSVHHGPDGLIYAVAEKDGVVIRFDPETHRRVDVAVSDDPATAEDELGGLVNPTSAVFGPDGRLYVAGFGSDEVRRLEGNVLVPFVDPGEGGLDGPDAGMLFLEDGTLLIPSFEANTVLHYDVDGTFLGEVAGPEMGLSNPRGLLVWQSRLLVTNWRSGQVLLMDLDGSNPSVFTQHERVSGIAVRPGTSEILLTSDGNNDVVRYDGATGERLGRLVDGAAAGIDGATFLSWL